LGLSSLGVIVGRFYLPRSGRSHSVLHVPGCPFTIAHWSRSWFGASPTLAELRVRLEPRARIEK
jgi:hypothetical protein